MKHAFNCFFIILELFFAGLAVTLGFAFFHELNIDLLPHFIIKYRLFEGIVLFIFYIPALQVTGLLTGYSVIFAENRREHDGSRASLMNNYMNGLFLLCVATTIFYLSLSEGIQPLMVSEQKRQIAFTERYREYMNLSCEFLNKKDYDEAGQYIKKALSIWPESDEANKIYDKIKIMSAVPAVNLQDSKSCRQTSDIGTSYICAEEVLRKAGCCMEQADYNTAAYYAYLASDMAGGNTELKKTALDLAKSAWEEIESGKNSLHTETVSKKFLSKKKAYEALMQQDILTAYYSFLELQNEITDEQSEKYDPDIKRFLASAEEELLRDMFFIDEIYNIPNFDAYRNINFFIHPETARQKQSNKDDFSFFNEHNSVEINFSGLACSDREKCPVLYLTNVTYARYNHKNVQNYKIHVPYAKIKVQNADTPSEYLQMQIHAVDRKVEGKEILPNIIEGSYFEELNSIRLPMTRDDFNMVLTASKGIEAMTLSELLRFKRIAKKYGFNPDVYRREIFARIADPFLLLIASLYIVIVAWRFKPSRREKCTLHKFIAFPAFLFVSSLLIQLIRYTAKILIAFFINIATEYGAVFLGIGSFSIMLTVLIILFCNIKTEA